MVEHTSAQAAARGWRMIILTGSIAFAVSYSLFHFVLPVSTWASIAPEPTVSFFPRRARRRPGHDDNGRLPRPEAAPR